MNIIITLKDVLDQRFSTWGARPPLGGMTKFQGRRVHYKKKKTTKYEDFIIFIFVISKKN